MSPSYFAMGLGGQKSPSPATKKVVSFWHLPGGYDVEKARVVEFFFDDLEGAVLFEKKFKAQPEMACMSDYPAKR